MADWIDQIDPNALKTATPTPAATPAANAGASGDWVSNIDPTTLAGPTFLERIGWRPATRQEAIVGRGAAIGALSPIDLAAHIVQSSGNINYSPLDLIASETGQQPTEAQEAATTSKGPNPLPEVIPSQQLLDFIGLKEPKNMTPGEQTESSIIPWVTPTPGMVGRIAEAPGLITKGTTAATSVAGGVADWFLSEAGQQYAQDHGWGPVATEIAGMLAPHVTRHLPGHIISGVDAVRKGDRPVLGQEGAGETWDDNRDLGVTPPIEDVAGDKLRSTVSALNASQVPGTGSSVAKDLQTKAIAKTFDEGKELVDPDAPSIVKGTPGTLNDYSEDLSTRAREQVDANRAAAKAESNRLEAPVVSAPIPAAPVQAALNDIITNKDKKYGVDTRDTAELLLKRFNRDVDPTDGTISFAQMKEQRENFQAEAAKLFPAQTGVATTKPTIGRNISPVEQAMTDGMTSVAGSDWAANDAKWSQNSRELRSLRGITGKLGRKSGDWGETPDSDKIAKKLTKSVKGNMPVLNALEQGMPGESRKATGQVLASLGKRAEGTGSTTFRPDLLATQYPSAVGKGMRARITNQGPVGPRGPEPPGRGAEALAKMDKAVAAAKGTVRPQAPGGLEEKLGALGRVGAFAHDIGGIGAVPVAAGFLGGPVGLGGALAARALLPRLLNDPSFVRLVAGRRFTADNLAGILAQYAQRAGLSATGPKPPSLSGAGASALSALKNLPSWPDAVSGVNRLLGGGQR